MKLTSSRVSRSSSYAASTAASILDFLYLSDDQESSDDTDDEDGDNESVCLDDFYIDDDVTADEQDTEALTEDQTENLNWFEKSVGVLRSGAARDSMDLDVKLQDEQLDFFRKGGRKEKFYDTLIENPDDLQKLLNNPDEYKRCRLRIESSHRSKAQVLDKDSEVPEIVITGRSKCGQTYMDDEVVVQIVGASAQQTGRSDSASATPANASGCVTYGRVVGLLKRVNFAGVEHPQFFCTLDELQSYLMKPLCKTVPKIHVMNDTLKRKHPSLIKHRVEIKQIGKDGRIRFKEFFNIVPGKREQYIFKVVLVVWSLGNIYPLGAVLDAFTGGKDCTSGIRLLSLREKVPNTYPQAVVRETSGLPTDPRPRMEGRINMTKRRMFTIDSPGSRDLDDALSVWKHEKHTVVGVHIADVAAVIQEGQAIDNEARKRGVTFYPLLREPHHMLPEPLSTDRCSLLPNKERLALSVLFTFNDRGEQVGNPTVEKTLIKSSQQLAYQEVQAIITGASAAQAKSDFDTVQSDIITLHQIATKLRKDRLQNSILFVPFEDPRLSELEDVKNSVEAHALVEEFMILANSYIAERLLSKFPQLMILRRQKAPTYEQLVEWRDKERGIGNLVMQLQGKNITPDTKLCFSTDTCNPEQDVIIKTDIWEALRRHLENGHLDKARRIAFMDDMHPLQCLANSHWMDLMETSEYKCSYGLNAPDRLHFGLNRACYTHFTSPIRRYADLHVHRLLHADLDGQTPCCTPDDVTALCHHINSATKRQRAFGNVCLSLKIAESLQHQPLVFRTFVDQVDSEQLTLMVPSLRAIFSRKQEVPFSILGVSSQPELLPDETQTGKAAGVSVKWKMRIYNERMTCPPEFAKVRKAVERLARSSPTLPLVFNINPHYLSVSVEQEEWADILHKLIQSNNPKRVAVPSTIERASQDVNYMTSEKDDGTVSLRPCHFKMKLSPGQVLQVQMSAEPQKGVLQPRVDLVHTARNASVCTRHVRDPVLTLSRPATRSTRRTHFSNYKDYACAWMPLLEMEAAYGAGGSDEGVVIENVNLAVAPQNVPNASRVNYTASFSLSAKFCFDRCIEFGGKSPDTADEEKPKSKGAFPLDYLCTGKTCTGVKLVYLFCKINRQLEKEGKGKKTVLFCGPSNKSVDLVARYLIQKLRDHCPKIVRMYGSAIESKDYPVPRGGLSSSRSTRDLKSDPELVVIIDECAMSPEPHSLVPIIATKARQVVLIGDHKQLRPIITCQAAADLGLDQSLFERLYEQYPANTVFLDTQYRMHRQICEFPSQEFYEGGLITKFKYQRSKEDEEDNKQKPWWMREPLPFWPRPKRVGEEVPHLLVDVRGQEESLSVSTEEGNEKSKSNAAEVEKVMEIVSFLKTCGVELQNIKVLTQYNAQRHQLEKKMKQVAAERAMGFTRYDVQHCQSAVCTVVSSQGGEWDYVILSTVRSLPSYKIEPNPTHGWCRQNLGFITDRNQVNVALTRARKGLIIVGR
nr:hypothetical protein BaRGS_033907 [Batillaria attramentaria]